MDWPYYDQVFTQMTREELDTIIRDPADEPIFIDDEMANNPLVKGVQYFKRQGHDLGIIENAPWPHEIDIIYDKMRERV